jgi:hypothetical protein
VVEGWRTGELENWRIGELENWRIGELEGWRVGGLEGWRVGVVEWWSGGVAEGWRVGGDPKTTGGRSRVCAGMQLRWQIAILGHDFFTREAPAQAELRPYLAPRLLS